jgi:hypothetical protein
MKWGTPLADAANKACFPRDCQCFLFRQGVAARRRGGRRPARHEPLPLAAISYGDEKGIRALIDQ